LQWRDGAGLACGAAPDRGSNAPRAAIAAAIKKRSSIAATNTCS
jgi:hypothetical protein